MAHERRVFPSGHADVYERQGVAAKNDVARYVGSERRPHDNKLILMADGSRAFASISTTWVRDIVLALGHPQNLEVAQLGDFYLSSNKLAQPVYKRETQSLDGKILPIRIVPPSEPIGPDDSDGRVLGMEKALVQRNIATTPDSPRKVSVGSFSNLVVSEFSHPSPYVNVALAVMEEISKRDDMSIPKKTILRLMDEINLPKLLEDNNISDTETQLKLARIEFIKALQRREIEELPAFSGVLKLDQNTFTFERVTFGKPAVFETKEYGEAITMPVLAPDGKETGYSYGYKFDRQEVDVPGKDEKQILYTVTYYHDEIAFVQVTFPEKINVKEITTEINGNDEPTIAEELPIGYKKLPNGPSFGVNP